MDTVFSNSSAAHDNQFSGGCFLFMAGLSLDLVGHYSQSCNKYKALAHVSGIEQCLAKGSGNTAFIPPVLYTFYYAVKKPSGVKRGF